MELQNRSLSFLVERAKRFGMNTKARREYVIDIKNPDITMVAPETKEMAIHKYYDVKEGDPKSPFIVEVPHHPKEEKNIHLIGSIISEQLSSSLVVCKKRNNHVNANAPWNWNVGKEVKEKSRSARAALYWVYEKLHNKFDWLGVDGKLKDKVYRLVLIGVDEKEPFDIIVATNYQSADRGVFETFKRVMEEKTGLKVTLAGKRDDKSEEAKRYSGFDNLAAFRKETSVEKNKHHPAFGEKHNTLQIGINKKHRMDEESSRKIAIAIAETMKEIQK